MNYYSRDYDRATRQTDRELIAKADEIITLYMSGTKSGRKESLKETKEYLALLEKRLTNSSGEGGAKKFSFMTREVEDALENMLHVDIDPIKIELELAVYRVRNMVHGDRIYDFGYDHNARFVDWTLRLLGLIQITAFNDSNKEYLSSHDRFFRAEDEHKYSGRKKLFYRNAYRAEMYSHKLYTDLNSEGQYDMYTPLILSRMAVEQYLKYTYEKHFGTPALEKPAECRDALQDASVISWCLSNEIRALLKRGNLNTHDGYASYVFANMHCIEVLKTCMNELQSN